MRYQEIIDRKQRRVRLFWSLILSLLALTLSGWLSPVGAQVWLCGEEISPGPHGIYRLRGDLECTEDTILHIEKAGSKFDLRDFTATGGGENDGILIKADGVKIVGGTFRNCNTALYVNKHDRCKIEKFTAINSSDIGIRIRGQGNSIVKSLCINAKDECFRLRVAIVPEPEDITEVPKHIKGNTAKWCTAINGDRGFRFRGPGHGYKLSAFNSGGEGIQINEEEIIEDVYYVSGVTINRCIIVNSAKHGIEIEDGTDNLIMHNNVFENGDGIDFWDLTDRNEECDGNVWKNNKFETRNLDCIN
jgi:parallel beta-helix repeat protein